MHERHPPPLCLPSGKLDKYPYSVQSQHLLFGERPRKRPRLDPKHSYRMGDAPEASSAAHGQGIQASRVASSDQLRRQSFTRPVQDMSSGMRRGHSDGDAIRPFPPSHVSSHAGLDRQRPQTDAYPPQRPDHRNELPHPNRQDPWFSFFGDLNDAQNLRNSNERRSANSSRGSWTSREEAIIHEQRKRAREAMDLYTRRRANTATSPQSRPIGLRRHAASASGTAEYGTPSNSGHQYRARPYNEFESPRPPPVPPHPHRRNSRNDEYVVPKWQPDAEVSSCPICRRPFTFFFRKHHCRKCGRVVCANCSPHRITIPRQYIVHPPSEDDNIGSDASGDSDEGNRANTAGAGLRQADTALGGGVEVRLCNPCVPDPNPLPPPSYAQSTSDYPSPYARHEASVARRHGWPAHQTESASYRHSAHVDTSTSPTNPFNRYRGHMPNPLSSYVRNLILAGRHI